MVDPIVVEEQIEEVKEEIKNPSLDAAERAALREQLASLKADLALLNGKIDKMAATPIAPSPAPPTPVVEPEPAKEPEAVVEKQPTSHDLWRRK